MKSEIEKQAEERVLRTIKKIVDNPELIDEVATAINSFAKLNKKEKRVLLKHHKRIESNTRLSTMLEIFLGIYSELKKEKQRLLKFEKKYAKEGNEKQARFFRQAILTIGINVENNIIRKLEKQIRKKYEYWKVD